MGQEGDDVRVDPCITSLEESAHALWGVLLWLKGLKRGGEGGVRGREASSFICVSLLSSLSKQWLESDKLHLCHNEDIISVHIIMASSTGAAPKNKSSRFHLLILTAIVR